jgi:16S rRNA (cytidine1402-2'-O)-methyltransferase
MVFFEAPHRLGVTLAAMADAFGADRRAAVCRELTKTYEEVLRRPLGELALWAQGEVRGEICVVVEGVTQQAAPGESELVAEVTALVEQGQRLKDAAAAVAARYDISKRDLYNAALAVRPR